MVQRVERRLELVDPVDLEAVVAQRVVFPTQCRALLRVEHKPQAADAAKGVTRQRLEPVE